MHTPPSQLPPPSLDPSTLMVWKDLARGVGIVCVCEWVCLCVCVCACACVCVCVCGGSRWGRGVVGVDDHSVMLSVNCRECDYFLSSNLCACIIVPAAL